jgi:hypothetical protein
MIRLFVLLMLALSLDVSAGESVDVTVRREVETNDKIAHIIARVAWGAVEDVFGKLAAIGNADASTRNSTADIGRILREMEPELRIDGTERTGIWSWIGAAYRIAGYALDTQHSGSVGYSYWIRIRGYHVRRDTWITDEHVLLTTSTGWVERVPITSRIVREVPIYVRIRVDATETEGPRCGTRILGTATGRAGLSDFECGIVRSIAARTAAEQLGIGLGRFGLDAETAARRWYAGGNEIGEILDDLQRAINFGRRVRR